MKKTYIIPTAEVVRINGGTLMLSTSETEIGGEEVLSHGYEGPAGGFLWEGDSEEK